MAGMTPQGRGSTGLRLWRSLPGNQEKARSNANQAPNSRGDVYRPPRGIRHRIEWLSKPRNLHAELGILEERLRQVCRIL